MFIKYIRLTSSLFGFACRTDFYILLLGNWFIGCCIFLLCYHYCFFLLGWNAAIGIECTFEYSWRHGTEFWHCWHVFPSSITFLFLACSNTVRYRMTRLVFSWHYIRIIYTIFFHSMLQYQCLKELLHNLATTLLP